MCMSPRNETLTVPLAALRGLLITVLCHRVHRHWAEPLVRESEAISFYVFRC